jgi:orotate phosphoribosyltransferase-like protein
MDRERNEDGQYVETLIDVFQAVYEGPHIMTTKEVADDLNCSREAARQRLLEDERIERKEVANGVVW